MRKRGDATMAKRQKSAKVNPIVTTLFLLLFVYFAASLVSQQSLIESKQAELARVQAQIAREEETAQELEEEKESLMSDESLERIAREKLGMVKPNERVYVDLNRQ